MVSIKWIVVSTVSVGVLALAGFAATQFTNPFAGVGNVGFGFKTTGQVKEALETQIADRSITVETPTGSIETTLGNIGVQVVNLDKVATELHSEKVFWKFPAWNRTSATKIKFTVDENSIVHVLQQNPDNKITSPAGVVYEDGKYVLVPSVTGLTVPVDALEKVAGEWVREQGNKPSVTVTAVEDTPMVDNTEAGALADKLNAVQAGLVFKVGQGTVKPVVETNLYTVENTSGELVVGVNENEVARIAETVPGLADRAGKKATIITDRSGGVLKTITAGETRREVKDTPMVIGKKTVDVLTNYETTVDVETDETTLKPDATVRRIIVDLSDQKTYLLENENIVKTFNVSTGLPGTATKPGNFRVRAFVRIQDMGCGPSSSYCTKNVPWVVYFNGDQAFHGTYWHNNFGSRMSHGCVNLPIADAKYVYDWANMNMEVEVRQ